MIDLDDNNRAQLSQFTKDLGNKLLNYYEKYSRMINEQRCENLRLQYEIGYLIKDKNSLKHDIKNLSNSITKFEKLLGINTNCDDCNNKSENIENIIYRNKTKPNFK